MVLSVFFILALGSHYCEIHMCSWFYFFSLFPIHYLGLSLGPSDSSHSTDFWPLGKLFQFSYTLRVVFLTLSFLQSNWQEKWLALDASLLQLVYSAFQWSCCLDHQLWISKVFSAHISLDFSEVKNMTLLTTSHCFWSSLFYCYIITHHFSLLFPTSTLLSHS